MLQVRVFASFTSTTCLIVIGLPTGPMQLPSIVYGLAFVSRMPEIDAKVADPESNQFLRFDDDTPRARGVATVLPCHRPGPAFAGEISTSCRPPPPLDLRDNACHASGRTPLLRQVAAAVSILSHRRSGTSGAGGQASVALAAPSPENLSRMRLWFDLALGTSLWACSMAPVVQPPPGQLPGDLAAVEFPGAEALLSGFDAPTEARAWETGDRLLFGLRLRKHGVEHRWLMLLRVVLGQTPMRVLAQPAAGNDGAPVEIDALQVDLPKGSWSYTIEHDGKRQEHVLTSPLCPVRVKVFDPRAKLLGDSTIHLPADLLARGMLHAVDAERSAVADVAAGGPDGAQIGDERLLAVTRSSVEAIIAAMSLLSVVQDDDLLASYFWQVVQKPSIWSAIANLGVSANLSMPFRDSVPATAVPAPLPPQPHAFVIPLRVDVNGSPALFADVLATDPRRPFSLCGGMVAVAAHHPTDRDLHFDVQLLAARVADPK
jgi:hypothetical protein